MREPIRPTTLRNHVVLVGHGRVGSFISSVLGEQSVPLFVIEDDEDGVAALRQEGIAALEGNAADPAVIAAANLPEARCLLVAIPDAFEGGQVVQQAHAINPGLPIIARAHSEEEIDYLKRHGATLVVMGEHEIAKAMLDNVAQIALLVAQSSREARGRAATVHAGGKSRLDQLKLSPPNHAALHAAHYDHRRRADARLGVRGGGAQGQGCRRWSAICSPASSSARSRRALSPTRISPASSPRSASSC